MPKRSMNSGCLARFGVPASFWMSILCLALQMPIVALAETPADFDLSSTQRNVRFGNATAQPVNVTTGARTRALTPGSMMTAAETVAVNQILATGQQSILLSRNGAAIGGQLNLSRDLSQPVQNMVIPKGVTALGDFSSLSNIIFSGNLTNVGNLFAYSSSTNSVATFSANNIANDRGALISSILPRSLASSLGTPRQSLDLSLVAYESIINHGTMESSGSLSLAANNIVNGSTLNGIASLQAANGINLVSPNITNSGNITALAQNINVNSATAANLAFNNTGGTLSALAGDINFRNPAFTEKFDISLSGGNIYSRELNLHSGCGTVSASIGDVSSKVNVMAGQAYITANNDVLNLGNLKLSDDPIFYNIGGSLHLSGDITTSGNFLALIAKQDIIHTSGIIDTSSSTGGGKIIMVAGWQNKPLGSSAQRSNANNADLFFIGPSSTGGRVDLTGTTILNASGTSGDASGGSIEITAFAGTNQNSGTVIIPCSIDLGGSGDGQNGSLHIIAGAPGGITIQVGNINAIGGSGAGTITLDSATPDLDGSGRLLVELGTLVTYPSFHGESPQHGDIQFGTIDTIGVTVSIHGAVNFTEIAINNFASQSPTVPMLITSLDLTDPVVVTQIVNLQQIPNSGISGSLLVNEFSGKATGGTLEIQSSNNLSNLSALNLPSGVTTTFVDFQEANPINVQLSPLSPLSKVEIGATTNFISPSGTSNPVITAMRTYVTPQNSVLFAYGNITSDGSITLQANGSMEITSNHILAATNLTIFSLPGSNGNINVGGVQESLGVTTIETNGTGYILQFDSSSQDSIVSGSTVHLKTESGKIGQTFPSSGIGRTVFVDAANIVIESTGGSAQIKALSNATLSIATPSGSTTVDADASILCHTSTIGGNLAITAVQNITIDGQVTSINGSLTFITDSSNTGSLSLAPSSILVANGGSLVLQNNDVTNGSISIGANSSLFARGKVTISIGAVPTSPVQGLPPEHLQTTQTLGGEIFFGTNGIVADVPNNEVNANYSDVIFDTKSLPASHITLGGNVIITTSNPVLSDLNFSNGGWRTWATIQELQNAGLLGGTLTIENVNNSTLPQGTVVITPNMLTPALTNIQIIQGVHVTLSGFDEDHPIKVGNSGLNGSSDFLIAEDLEFVNTSNAIIDLSSNILFPTITASLTSSGSLALSTTGFLQIYGQVIANERLTINVGQSFQNGGHFGSSALTSLLQGTSVNINSLSTEPLFFLGVGSISSLSGTTITAASGSIIFGQQGWNACRQTITGPAIIESESIYISKDSFIHVSSAFTITADSIVNAGGPNALVGHPLIYGYDGRALTSLNLENPIIAAKLQSAQLQGLIDGTLILQGGKIIGGTLILHPENLADSLSSLVIPKNVTVTFENFDASHPLNFTISSASSNKQVVINGQTIFSGDIPANAVINMVSDLGGTVLNVGRTGLLSSTGTLALNANADLSIGGALVGEISLTTSGSIALKENIGSADKPFSITLTGAGGVTQMVGKVLRAGTLTLMGSGNFGSAKSTIRVETDNLTATTTGIVNVSNTKVLNLRDSTSSSLLVSAIGGMTVHNVHTIGGSMTLSSKGGVLQVASGSELKSVGGSLSIQNTDQRLGAIIIESDVSLLATQLETRDSLSVVIGPAPGIPVAGSAPGNTITLLNGGKTYFGKTGITSTNNSFTADGRKIIFSTGRLPASAIMLESNITTTATSQNISYEAESPDLNSCLDSYVDTGDMCDEDG